MSRTGVRQANAWLLAGAVAGSLVAIRAAGGSTGALAGTEDRYVVRSGDSLWELARRRVGPEGDPRPLVDGIRRANGMESSRLLVGQELILPGP